MGWKSTRVQSQTTVCVCVRVRVRVCVAMCSHESVHFRLCVGRFEPRHTRTHARTHARTRKTVLQLSAWLNGGAAL